MKLVMDEKLKHRLIGLAVIISIAAIFAPAVIHKSNQNLETISVRVAVPPKPPAPDVVLSNEKELFKTIKIAKVKLPEVSPEKQLPEQIKAESIRIEPSADEARPLSKAEPQIDKKPVNIASNHPEKIKPNFVKSVRSPGIQIKAKSKIIAKKSISIKKDSYTIQLASFSKLANAQTLLTKLKAKGYKPNLTKIAARQGTVYKVSVGKMPNKSVAMHLRNQLANLVQLNGFIVNTGVS